MGDEELEEDEEEKEKGWLEKVREKLIGRRRWEDWERHLEGGDGELSEEDVRLVWLRR